MGRMVKIAAALGLFLLLAAGCEELEIADGGRDLPEGPPMMKAYAGEEECESLLVGYQWEITKGVKKGYEAGKPGEDPFGAELNELSIAPGENMQLVFAGEPEPTGLSIVFYPEGEEGGEGLKLDYEIPLDPEDDRFREDAFALFPAPDDPAGVFVIKARWAEWQGRGVAGEADYAFRGTSPEPVPEG